jgi:hypothetical protein
MPYSVGNAARLTANTELMAFEQQEALTEQPRGLRRRVWCRGCRRELTDRESRLRGWGRECDPDQRTGHERHDVDQDPIPGL